MKLLFNTEISCAHYIPDSDKLITKKCATKHGHNYKIRVELERAESQDFLDFAILKSRVWKVLVKYDHQDLSDFALHTVEQLAARISDELTEEFEVLSSSRVGVTIFETENYGVSYP